MPALGRTTRTSLDDERELRIRRYSASLASVQRGSKPAFELKFSHVSYFVKTRTKDGPATQTILNDVSGKFRPGKYYCDTCHSKKEVFFD